MASWLWSVEQAYRMARVLTGPRRLLSPSEKLEAKHIANGMLDGWRIEELMVYQILREECELVADQQEYTVGSGGEFDISRPEEILRAAVLIDDQEVPIEVIRTPEQQWARIRDKSSSADYPEKLYYRRSVPLGTAAFVPIPSQVSTVVLYVPSAIAEIDDLDDDVEFPQGYREGFEYCLATEVHDRYPDKRMSPRVEERANLFKGRIKGSNVKPVFITPDIGAGPSDQTGEFDNRWF